MKQSFKKEEIPETLKDHIFYGFTLDEDQKVFRDAIWDKDNIVTICNAKAGTGKTTIALGVANLLYHYRGYDKIVYIVSPTMEQKQGFIPGDPDDKNAPYRQPLDDALLTLGINPNMVIKSEDNMHNVKRGNAYISFVSHTYLRGCNFENEIIIIDEAQNFFFDELKKTLTRIHDNCKVIVVGHTGQCDIIKHPERSGFQKYLDAFIEVSDDERVSVCELRHNYRGWLSNFCDNVL